MREGGGQTKKGKSKKKEKAKTNHMKS